MTNTTDTIKSKKKPKMWGTFFFTHKMHLIFANTYFLLMQYINVFALLHQTGTHKVMVVIMNFKIVTI